MQSSEKGVSEKGVSEKGVNVNVVILKHLNSKVLLVKNKARQKEIDGNKFFKPSKWGLPNGRKEKGENDLETGIRETKQETGFQIEIEPNIKIEEDVGDHINIVLLGRIVGGEKEIPPEEIIDCEWFPVDSLPLPMYFSHKQRLSEMRKTLSKRGVEV